MCIKYITMDLGHEATSPFHKSLKFMLSKENVQSGNMGESLCVWGWEGLCLQKVSLTYPGIIFSQESTVNIYFKQNLYNNLKLNIQLESMNMLCKSGPMTPFRKCWKSFGL